MQIENPSIDPSPKRRGPSAREWWVVIALQALFFIAAVPHLREPLQSMHAVRQCQTFDVARHIFREGWSAMITPKASFTTLSSPWVSSSDIVPGAPSTTVVRLEVPFHGILGWPAAQLFPHDYIAIVRLISVAFAMLSIALFFLVLRFWLEADAALAGTALWTTVPLMIHCGVVPVPDILATTGIILSFCLAQRGRLAGSSVAFLFAILAKLNVIVYGLPILAAVLVALKCRSIAQFLKISVAWGLVPLVGVVGWVALGRFDPPRSWEIVGGFTPNAYGPPSLNDLLTLHFYRLTPLFLGAFGCGIMGVGGLFFALKRSPVYLNPLVKLAIILSLVATYLLERIAWIEAQYALPVVFWIVLAASLGFPALLEKVRENRSWRIAVAGLVILHLAVAGVSAHYLELDRVHNLPAIQEAARFIPPDARVVVCSEVILVGPPVWLDRNTISLGTFFDNTEKELDRQAQRIETCRKEGFTYLLVFDTESTQRTNPIGRSKPVYETDLTSADSPVRKFLAQKYPTVYAGDHTVLYALKDK